MKTHFLAVLALILCGSLRAENSPNPASRLPVSEVTVFKDGHAFVVQEGAVNVNENGEVLLDEAPSPVLGTFWVYTPDKENKIASVVSGQHIVPISRTALSLREMIEANPNSKVMVTENGQPAYGATLRGFLTRSTAELAATSPPNASDQLPQKSNSVLLETGLGSKVVALEQIQSLVFTDKPSTSGPQPEFRGFLKVAVKDAEGRAAKSPKIGMVYLQSGIRWIPSYRVDLDGAGKAVIKLQAALINEMMDLTNATINLVIGVPSFAFKDMIDPMAIQQAAAQLSQYFQSNGDTRLQALGRNFSNAIMSQQPRFAPAEGAAAAPGLPSDLPEGAKNEDLYVFTLRNISLRKGERMLVPVSERILSYSDLFTLDIPFAPPTEIGRSLGSQQQADLARLMAAPKAIHKVRLTNGADQPLTTAPALIFRDAKLIAQGLMTYAAPGATADLSLTTAIDIQVSKEDAETNRTPNALEVQGNHYMRVDLKGKIHLVNRRGAAIQIEVNRYVLGQADGANHDAKMQMVNLFEDRQYQPLVNPDYATPWWNDYAWPWWWNHVNGAGRITWNLKLDPGQSIDLDYTWHYFWL